MVQAGLQQGCRVDRRDEYKIYIKKVFLPRVSFVGYGMALWPKQRNSSMICSVPFAGIATAARIGRGKCVEKNRNVIFNMLPDSFLHLL